MSNPNFDRIGRRDQPLVAGEKYPVPAHATHVGVRNGGLGFFQSDNCRGKEHRSENSHRRFIPIPDGTRSVSFPDFQRKVSGHHYPPPVWV